MVIKFNCVKPKNTESAPLLNFKKIVTCFRSWS